MVIQWFPGHMAKATREVKEKLKLVDIVFELVDARCPLSSHNMYLDEVVKDKKKIIIFNKIDLCDRAETAKWKSYFENKGYTVVYTDAKNSNNFRINCYSNCFSRINSYGRCYWSWRTR